MEKKVGRKVRTDKLRDVKPFISSELKDSIYRLSYITTTPVKDICKELCINAINNKHIIEELSNYFQRNLRINNTLFLGNIENPKLHTKKGGAKKERISLRLNNELYEFIYRLSYALNCSVSRVVSFLLERGMHDITFINNYINKHIHSIDERQKKELQKILDYISEGLEHDISLASLFSYILEEFKGPVHSTKDAISDFIKQWRSWKKG